MIINVQKSDVNIDLSPVNEVSTLTLKLYVQNAEGRLLEVTRRLPFTITLKDLQQEDHLKSESMDTHTLMVEGDKIFENLSFEDAVEWFQFAFKNIKSLEIKNINDPDIEADYAARVCLFNPPTLNMVVYGEDMRMLVRKISSLLIAASKL